MFPGEHSFSRVAIKIFLRSRVVHDTQYFISVTCFEGRPCSLSYIPSAPFIFCHYVFWSSYDIIYDCPLVNVLFHFIPRKAVGF